MDVGPACLLRSPLVFQVGAEPHFPCLEQFPTDRNHRNGYHMEDYQWGSGKGRQGEKVQRISSINGREKIDRGRLRIV